SHGLEEVGPVEDETPREVRGGRDGGRLDGAMGWAERSASREWATASTANGRDSRGLARRSPRLAPLSPKEPPLSNVVPCGGSSCASRSAASLHSSQRSPSSTATSHPPPRSPRLRHRSRPPLPSRIPWPPRPSTRPPPP